MAIHTPPWNPDKANNPKLLNESIIDNSLTHLYISLFHNTWTPPAIIPTIKAAPGLVIKPLDDAIAIPP